MRTLVFFGGHPEVASMLRSTKQTIAVSNLHRIPPTRRINFSTSKEQKHDRQVCPYKDRS